MLFTAAPRMKGKKVINHDGLVSGKAILGSTAAGASLDYETILLGQGDMLMIGASMTAVFNEGE